MCCDCVNRSAGTRWRAARCGGQGEARELEADTASHGRPARRGEDDPCSRAGAGRRCPAADTRRVDGAAVRAPLGRLRWEARRPGRPTHLGRPPGVASGRVRDPRLRLLVPGGAVRPPRDRRARRRRLRAALPDSSRGGTPGARDGAVARRPRRRSSRWPSRIMSGSVPCSHRPHPTSSKAALSLRLRYRSRAGPRGLLTDGPRFRVSTPDRAAGCPRGPRPHIEPCPGDHPEGRFISVRSPTLAEGGSEWCTGDVTAGSSSTRHTFRVCLLATDQLSIDDRRCRRFLLRR